MHLNEPSTTIPDTPDVIYSHPQLIFATELDGGTLQELLLGRKLLDHVVANEYGLAMALTDFNDEMANAVRVLNAHGIYIVAWLLLPPAEGCWFNLQNYPQAIEHYQAFRAWAQHHHLSFDAVGLDIEPPMSESLDSKRWGFRELARHHWLAHENVLYPAARAAYTELVSDIRRDGYEVHTYQIPLLVDDRRAGTTMVQRALDVVDLDADVEVLMCYSSLPVESFRGDLGGALIASYGSAADSIGIIGMGNGDPLHPLYTPNDPLPHLSWETLERDMLLASRYTDTIYIFLLEGCIKRDVFSRIETINWEAEPTVLRHQRLFVEGMRTLLLLILAMTRFGRQLFAWLGWGIAILLLLRQRKASRHHRNK